MLDVGANAENRPYHLLQYACLLYTSDAADEGLGVALGGRRIIKTKSN
ncbi:phosphate acyltransferase [Lacticaseibacillus rhamnosus]|nr:phosphate acyltransferase [Lacticaseibacillus rhamnosus]